MDNFATNEVEYVKWQNKSTHFYLGARRLHLSEVFLPALYCSKLAIELLLKGTLVYHGGLREKRYGHNVRKLVSDVSDRIKRSIDVPQYFLSDLYDTSIRYPDSGSSVLRVYRGALDDLDQCFASIVMHVPFQHNTLLKNTLLRPDHRYNALICRDNTAELLLREFFASRVE